MFVFGGLEKVIHSEEVGKTFHRPVISAVAVNVEFNRNVLLVAAGGGRGFVHNRERIVAVSGVDNQLSVIIDFGISLRQVCSVRRGQPVIDQSHHIGNTAPAVGKTQSGQQSRCRNLLALGVKNCQSDIAVGNLNILIGRVNKGSAAGEF